MKKIKINIPQGMEIDKDNSNLEDGIIQFKEKEIDLPKSWSEVNNHQKRLVERRLTGSTPDKYESLMKLEILRDIYRGDWKPNWDESEEKWSYKYIIYHSGKKILDGKSSKHHYFLSFPTPEIRDDFKYYFRNLIEECKDFI